MQYATDLPGAGVLVGLRPLAGGGDADDALEDELTGVGDALVWGPVSIGLGEIVAMAHSVVESVLLAFEENTLLGRGQLDAEVVSEGVVDVVERLVVAVEALVSGTLGDLHFVDAKLPHEFVELGVGSPTEKKTSGLGIGVDTNVAGFKVEFAEFGGGAITDVLEEARVDVERIGEVLDLTVGKVVVEKIADEVVDDSDQVVEFECGLVVGHRDVELFGGALYSKHMGESLFELFLCADDDHAVNLNATDLDLGQLADVELERLDSRLRVQDSRHERRRNGLHQRLDDELDRRVVEVHDLLDSLPIHCLGSGPGDGSLELFESEQIRNLAVDRSVSKIGKWEHHRSPTNVSRLSESQGALGPLVHTPGISSHGVGHLGPFGDLFVHGEFEFLVGRGYHNKVWVLQCHFGHLVNQGKQVLLNDLRGLGSLAIVQSMQNQDLIFL